MSGEGTRERERFMDRMQSIAVGARLKRRLTWTVVHQRHTETGVMLTLRRGRRSFSAYVSICHTGPELWDAGLQSVAPAPVQRELRMEGDAA